MKTKFFSLFLFFFLTSIVDGFCAYIPIAASNVTYSQNVNLFDLFEVSFLTYTTQNPYDPDSITVYGVFIGPDNERDTVLGFYYECYNLSYYDGFEHATANPSANRWKVRFTPDKVGAWSFYLTGYVINSALPPQESPARIMYSFNCLAVNEADGFISVANSRYLKRDAVRNGQRQFRSFFPIGPNIPWYSLKNDSLEKPKGFHYYERYVDSLYNNCNYMRVWLSRYQALSLYGPEYTQTDQDGNPVVYFDNTINQKDAAEDTIFGWCQDTAFAYQSLRWLTDSLNPIDHPEYPWHFKDSIDPFDPGGYVYTMDELKKPAPSSNSNTVTIPITSQPANTNYAVRWYNAETGAEYIGCSNYRQVQQEANGDKYITITFPTTVRNQSSHTVTNRFGDAVFTLVKYFSPKKDD